MTTRRSFLQALAGVLPLAWLGSKAQASEDEQVAAAIRAALSDEEFEKWEPDEIITLEQPDNVVWSGVYPDAPRWRYGVDDTGAQWLMDVQTGERTLVPALDVITFNKKTGAISVSPPSPRLCALRQHDT